MNGGSDFSFFKLTKSETMVTCSVLKQDPNTQKVQKNAEFSRITQCLYTFSRHSSGAV